MPKNYYIILGISSDSSQGDIKAAYRRLAKKFHPDLYGQKSSPFQVIHEAYSVLGNPKTRRSYDLSLQSEVRGDSHVNINSRSAWADEEAEPLVPESEMVRSQVTDVDRSLHHQWSMFDDVFDGFLSGFTEYRQPGMRRSNLVAIEIALSPMQAQRGGNVSVNLPVQMHCPFCYRYSGSGFICWRCNGTGILHGEKPLHINYPAGISNNHAIKLALTDLGVQQGYLKVMFKVS